MEYEYSFKVSKLDKYLDIIKSRYKYINTYNEKRVIYRKNDSNDTIARITYKDNCMYLDFKENKIGNNDLTVRKETKSIVFDNFDNCENILEFLGYYRDNSIYRKRTIYQGDEIKFEIDEYYEPENVLVLSFEGKKEICNKVYKDFEKLNKKYKI